MKKLILTSLITTLILTSTIAANIPLKWSANPAVENVIKYNVYMATGASSITYVFIASTTNTSYTFTNLNIGVYKFKISAVNEWGEGPASIPIQTAPSVPTSPVDVSF